MIPVIDVSRAYEGRDLDRIANEVTWACSEIGFFQIVGAQVDQGLIDRTYSLFEKFFAEPLEYKSSFRTPSNPLRGYSGGGNKSGAFQECFETNSIESLAEATAIGINPAYQRAFEDITWPDLPGLRDTALELFAAERELATLMMSLFARGLGLDPEHFKGRFEPDGSSFACRNYVGKGAGGNEELLQEHTDSGGITLLHQRGNYSGLQIRLLSGEIVTVPVRPDAIVVNVGDLMTRWTNGKLRATPHRVVSPTAEGENRQSIALFHAPAIAVEIAPEPELVGPDGPNYDPVQFYELMLPFWQGYSKTGRRAQG